MFVEFLVPRSGLPEGGGGGKGRGGKGGERNPNDWRRSVVGDLKRKRERRGIREGIGERQRGKRRW